MQGREQGANRTEENRWAIIDHSLDPGLVSEPLLKYRPTIKEIFFNVSQLAGVSSEERKWI